MKTRAWLLELNDFRPSKPFFFFGSDYVRIVAARPLPLFYSISVASFGRIGRGRRQKERPEYPGGRIANGIPQVS